MPDLEYPTELKADNIPYILFKAKPYVTKIAQKDKEGSQDPTGEHTIRIALPPQLTSQDGFNYESTTLLKTEAIANFLNGDFGESAAAAAAALVAEVGFDGLQQATQAFTGKSVNPKEELLFKSPTLRSHSFTFNMFARSSTEARTIVAIIKQFRLLAYPSTSSSNAGSGSFYTFPHEFSISQHPFQLKNFGNGFPPIPHAVCTSIDTNFGGGGRTVLTRDNFFQAIDLTLTFQDLRTMTSESITGPIDKDKSGEDA